LSYQIYLAKYPQDKYMIIFRLLALCSILLLSACSKSADKNQTEAAKNFQQSLMEQLIDAKKGDVILIPKGVHSIDRSLSLRVDGVTIRGEGMNESILSFKNQVQGAEGLLIADADNFTIEDVAIEDAIGDGIKVNGGENIVFRRVRTEWTDGYKTENGAYGFYPVQTKNVLIEDSVAIGASDAGIYVGQSDNVIVRRNRAEFNVAGIEIENTLNADVYENIATNNTGGILVFNMPHLKQEGGKTRVFNNEVFENSNDAVEIFDNNISNNKTSNIIISSIYTSGYEDLEQQSTFDGYPESIYIYNNTFEGGGNSPDRLELKALKTMMFGFNGELPDVLWDGFIDQNKLQDGKLPAELNICIDNGDIDILNADAPNEFKNPRLVTADHQCTHDKLPTIVLPFALETQASNQ